MPALALAIDLNEDCGINDRFISESGRSKTEQRPLSIVNCRFVKCVFFLASWQNGAKWSKLLRAVSSKISSKMELGYY